MQLGRVTTAIVAPTKHPSLVGSKFLAVEIEDRTLLTFDSVGAGIGDQVIVAIGSHAVGVVAPGVAVDAVIVGIVDPPTALPERVTRRVPKTGGKSDG